MSGLTVERRRLLSTEWATTRSESGEMRKADLGRSERPSTVYQGGRTYLRDRRLPRGESDGASVGALVFAG
jgi:hypothetical protein